MNSNIAVTFSKGALQDLKNLDANMAFKTLKQVYKLAIDPRAGKPIQSGKKFDLYHLNMGGHWVVYSFGSANIPHVIGVTPHP